MRSDTPRAPAAQPDGDALLRVAAAAAGAHELEDVLESAAEEARRATRAASLSVSRWERDRGQLRVLVNVGDLAPGEERFPRDECYPVGIDRKAERLLLEGKTYFSAEDDPDLDEFSADRLSTLGKETEVGVPILVEGEPWGEIYATTSHGNPRFRGEDIRFLEAVAGQLASVISRAEQFKRVSRLAYEDPLTGLANRRAIEERLERATARDVPLAVLLCDLDDLKSINDTRGHEAGDAALRQVGEALVVAAATRPGNLVGRLAGDEFCVVLENAALDDARALASAALDTLGKSRAAVMISCGAAERGTGVATPAQLLRAADAALYRAKRNGGGQIFTAGTRARARRTDRRALRRTSPDRVRASVRELAAELDGRLADNGALERIEAVAAGLSDALNAAAWAISFAPAGSGFIRTVSIADGRDQRIEGLRIEVDNDVYAVYEYPATAALIEAGAGFFTLRVDDENGDPAERALLEHYARTGVLAVAAADHDGTWLLEIYSDTASGSLEEAALDAGLLMRAAIPPRPAGRGRGAMLERRTAQLRLAGELGLRLSTLADERSILRATVTWVQQGMGADAAMVARMVSETSCELVAFSGLEGGEERVGELAPTNRGLVARSMRERAPVLAPDVRAEPDYYPMPGSTGTLSELDVPVMVGGELWGALSIQSNELDAFDEEDARVAQVVAAQLGAALSYLH